MNPKILENYEFCYRIFQSIVTLLIIIIFSAYMSFLERRILGLFQNRYGPNRVGWNGSLQLIADMIKILFKEDWVPTFADKTLFILSPIIAFISLLTVFAIIPVTPNWIISNFNIGVLFFLMMSGLSIYSVLLAGWSSNNKYSLLGAIRASAQILSYEVFIGLSLMGIVIKSGSFNLIDIINDQKTLWNVIPQFLGFITFFLAGIALCHRHPFDHPEAEQELSDGYHIEYSGIKFSLFFIGNYINLIVISSLMVVLFFGGWNGPWMYPILWFITKDIILILIFILIRASLPRPRYDQIILLGWKICLPVTIINLLVTSAVVLFMD